MALNGKPTRPTSPRPRLFGVLLVAALVAAALRYLSVDCFAQVPKTTRRRTQVSELRPDGSVGLVPPLPPSYQPPRLEGPQPEEGRWTPRAAPDAGARTEAKAPSKKASLASPKKLSLGTQASPKKLSLGTQAPGRRAHTSTAYAPAAPAASEAFNEGAGDTEEDVRHWAIERAEFSRKLEERQGGEAEELHREAESRPAQYFKDFPEIAKTLREQQRKSIQHCLLRRGRCLIADEMGLGKTLSSLVVANLYSEEWPMLIISPTSVTKNWVAEVQKWFPHLASDVMELSSPVLNKRPLIKQWAEKLIFVVSYDQVRRRPILGRRPDGSPYQVVIVDEAHYLKTPYNKRSEAIVPICHAARRCILLTGTPVLNHAAETWTLMSVLDPKMPSYESFCQRYCDFKDHRAADGTVTPQPYGLRNKQELHPAFWSFIARAKAKETLPDMALKSRRKINFREKIDSKHIQKIMGIILSSQQSKDKKVKLMLPAKICSATAKAKAGPVTDYVRDFLDSCEPDCKVVVFGHHHAILDKVQEMLDKTERRGRYVRLDGKVPPRLRQARIQSFQEDPEVQVALVGIMACGQGIELTAAKKVIFTELHWVPARLLQAESRVHRHGQTQDVDVVYCVVSGKPFMDDTILQKLADKEQIANYITDGQELQSEFAPLAP